MMESSRVTILGAVDFLLRVAATLGPGKFLEDDDVLGDHFRALVLALLRADGQRPRSVLLRELAAAKMLSKGWFINKALGTLDTT